MVMTCIESGLKYKDETTKTVCDKVREYVPMVVKGVQVMTWVGVMYVVYQTYDDACEAKNNVFDMFC